MSDGVHDRSAAMRHARVFVVALLLAVLVGLAMRTVFPLADPPWRSTVGVVWHDEGAWVHNARNRALFGEWSLDRWNPMYITPVLTGLEYLSFSAFGVGLWQARLVSEAMGVLSVLLIGLGVARVGGRLAGGIAAAFLACNFVYVMYDRAALMEATMIALVVVSWYCSTRAAESPRWGLLTGVFAVAAYFTKASAVFFIGALGVNALWSLVEARLRPGDRQTKDAKAAWWTLAGLASASLLGLLVFVGPHWSDYRFYNWQMSVTRKPSYSIKSFVDRASWLPIVHDFFTRMWPVLALGLLGLMNVVSTWRRAAAAERVVALWIALGMTELILHDVGNERRLVFLVPAFIVLAALVLGRDRRLIDPDVASIRRSRTLTAAPIVLAALYLAAGSLIRMPSVSDIYAHVLSPTVRWSAAVALVVAGLLYATWPRVPRALARVAWTPAWAVAVCLLALSVDAWQFADWAVYRTYKNYDAMVSVGHALPAGTLVHGKLANGLDLENRIKPVFVGRGFGNFEDRASRPDIRYVLTYIDPSLGYESQANHPVIMDVLDTCPGWKVMQTFDVAESTGGHDRVALIDKYPQR